jgi:hypothetical protein
MTGRKKIDEKIWINQASEFGNSTTVGPRKSSLVPTVEEFLIFVCPYSSRVKLRSFQIAS